MRKFLTVLLTVLMIASVFTMLPAGAAADENKTFDNTTIADLPDLVVTEVVTNSGKDDGKGEDCYDYIEIYNRGDSTVSLDGLSILAQQDFNATGGPTPWNSTNMFHNRLNIVSGDIFSAPGLDNVLLGKYGEDKTYFPVTNPTDLNLAPGQFAVIWVWNNDCYSASADLSSSLAAPGTVTRGDSSEEVPFAKLYDYYFTKTGSMIPKDTLVLAVCGYTFQPEDDKDTANPNINKLGDPIDLKNGNNYIYAIADNSWRIEEDKAFVVNAVTKERSANEKIHCMFSVGYGVQGVAGILTNKQDTSIIFAPADQKPVLFNAEWQNGLDEGGYLCVCGYEYSPKENNNVNFADVAATWKCPECQSGKTEFATFMDINYVHSYREVAVMAFDEVPTPGAMEAYQWAFVDEDSESIPEAITSVTGWQTASVAHLISEKVKPVAKGEDKHEDKVTIDQVDRDLLGNLGQNTIVIMKSTAIKCTACEKKLYASRLVCEYNLKTTEKTDYTEVEKMTFEQMMTFITEKEIACGNCGGKTFVATAEGGAGAKSGLPTWALILIIVGAVLVVGGGAAVVVVFVVLKKKPAAEAEAAEALADAEPEASEAAPEE